MAIDFVKINQEYICDDMKHTLKGEKRWMPDFTIAKKLI
jgi:hypothetical protein